MNASHFCESQTGEQNLGGKNLEALILVTGHTTTKGTLPQSHVSTKLVTLQHMSVAILANWTVLAALFMARMLQLTTPNRNVNKH